jgi:TonB family protein
MKYFLVSLAFHILAVFSISSSIAANSQQNYEVSFLSSEKKTTQPRATQKVLSKESKAIASRPSEASVQASSETLTDPHPNSNGTLSLNGQIGSTQSVFNYLINQIYKNRIYPHESIRLKQQGKVTISFYINEDGDITDIQLAAPCTHKLLNLAAVKTLNQIKIKKDLPEVEKLYNRNYSFTFDFEITKTSKT